VHLELLLTLEVALLLDASTPQGCIWNGVLRVLPGGDTGASTPQGCIWNHHAMAVKPPLGGASTPQGCIWNWRSSNVRPRSVFASTPQGCIWNRRPGERCADSRRFNPTRVHLEPRDHDDRDRGDCASTPQGCIWNSVTPHCWRMSDLLQPHKGASGTAVSVCSPSSVYVLQPHKGTSGTRNPCQIYRRSCCFSPTRVHLERNSERSSPPQRTALQPHKGTSGT